MSTEGTLFERFKRLREAAHKPGPEPAAGRSEAPPGPDQSHSKSVSEISPPSPPDRSKPGATDPTSEALALINRLKTFTLPASRVPQARAMVDRAVAIASAPIETWRPASILSTLRAIESELIALGGTPDIELADVVTMVERAFPGAKLGEIRKPRVTREDRARLRDLGYSDHDIGYMDRATVQRIFDHHDLDDPEDKR